MNSLWITMIMYSLAVALHQNPKGLLERYIQKLGKMLNAYSEQPGSWNVAPSYLVFCIRGSPATSLRWYSPNELILWSWFIGLLCLLKASSWEDSQAADCPPRVSEYFDRMKQTMEQVEETASEFFKKLQDQQKVCYYGKAKSRHFCDQR